MKKYFLCFLLALSLPVFAQTAKIKIDIDRTIGEIDPKIYGVFMEPIHFNGRRMGLPDTVDFNTLYGNLYDPSSPLADRSGFRKDYIDAMKESRSLICAGLVEISSWVTTGRTALGPRPSALSVSILHGAAPITIMSVRMNGLN
jgi:hypothetical protein